MGNKVSSSSTISGKTLRVWPTNSILSQHPPHSGFHAGAFFAPHSPGFNSPVKRQGLLTQVVAGIDPLRLDSTNLNLFNVRREGDATANTTRSPVAFFSPDTFNYATLSFLADGCTLDVGVQGINSYAANTSPEPEATTNVREIFGFSLMAVPARSSIALLGFKRVARRPSPSGPNRFPAISKHPDSPAAPPHQRGRFHVKHRYVQPYCRSGRNGSYFPCSQ